tara:strand:- start:1626 stop:1865 length:240 start_codon:yes stop_codon:yes gene_type:complete
MKKILLFAFCIPFFSCSSDSVSNVSDNDVDDCIGCGDENIKYIKIQKQIQTSYSLQKALNTGAISQDEYDRLKTELFNL